MRRPISQFEATLLDAFHGHRALVLVTRQDGLVGLLRRGILAHGFARIRCDSCGHERLLAFSCKGRGVCPSGNARRMAEVAAHLTDRVFPWLPVRQ